MISIYLFSVAISIVGYLGLFKIFHSVRQYERVEGLKSHQSKNGTLTLGGIFFCIPCFIFIFIYRELFFLFFSVILFYLIGLLDDGLKIVRKNNLGLTSKCKLLLQITAGMLCSVAYYFQVREANFLILGIIALAFISSSNAYNLTDGCDGLLSGLCLIMGIGWCIILAVLEDHELMIVHLVIMGILFSFFYFNVSRAYIFMGDTGSLFLGAYNCALGIYLNCIPLFMIMSSIIIFETVSVIIQVSYYKISKGKRVFKMAPFHHHLEAKDMSEVMVNFTFILLQIILVIVSLILGNYL